MYSANGHKAGSDKITLYPLRPTLKALGEYIAKHDAKFGYDNVVYAIYKGRKFHAYYTLEGSKLVKQGTLFLSYDGRLTI